MAGPTCSVLSSIPCVADELLAELIQLTGSTGDKDAFSVGSTKAIGGTYDGEARPFIGFREPFDADEQIAVAEVLRFAPTQDIGLAAMCNQNADHQILGEMALWIAQKTSGFVDLGGVIESVPNELPGRVAKVPYELAAGGTGEYMVMDQVAFRAWLTCTAFRMVK